MPSDLHSLAARAEAAEGPDRELDAAVWWQAARRSFLSRYWQGAMGLPRELTEMPKLDGIGGLGVLIGAPAYTASLDAALTLASDFTEVQLWNLWNEALCQCSKAEASLRDDLARFVVAAACRARATQGENDG
jgi:hypothetical protein